MYIYIYIMFIVSHTLTDKMSNLEKNLDIHKHIEQKKKKVCTIAMVYNNENTHTHTHTNCFDDMNTRSTTMTPPEVNYT